MSQKKIEYQPEWSKEAPLRGSYRSIFKWGDPNAFKHPNQRLFALLKKRFKLSDDHFKRKRFEGHEAVICHKTVTISAEQIEAIQEIVGAENVTADDFSRVNYSNGRAMEEAILLRQRINGPVCDLVVHPRHKREVKSLVLFCDKERIPIYVYGGGSSVTMAFKPVRGGITLVMSTHMNRVVAFSEVNQTIRVQAGMMGPDYEDALNNAPEKLGATHRYTGGHFPQSFEFSSVGGWVVTLGSGQQSSYYGDAYHLVISQEYVTPRGDFVTLDYPATATGPKVNDIMKGSEGAFGVLVELTMRVYRHMPENQMDFSFLFPDWKAAVDASREISQGEFGMPSVFRISDREETEIALNLYNVEGTLLDRMIRFRGFTPGERCLCVGHSEGERGFSKYVRQRVKKICKRHGAMYLTGYPMKNWRRGRFSDPYMREELQDFGIVTDTLETGVTWENLDRLYRGVRAFITDRPRTICMTHASHFYPQGTNLYFIFLSSFNALEEYQAFQRGIIETIQSHGGSLSHHHGVGRLMAPWMKEHLGKEQMGVLKALKKHFDPNNIMNPGGLLGLDHQ